MRLSNFKSSLLACLIVILAVSLVGAAEGITLISKDQLKEELAKPGIVVIDVRAPHDWDSAQWKIQGARRESPCRNRAMDGQLPEGQNDRFILRLNQRGD